MISSIIRKWVSVVAIVPVIGVAVLVSMGRSTTTVTVRPIEWTPHEIPEAENDGIAVCAADLDGDYLKDIIVLRGDISCTFAEVIWFENTCGCPVSWIRHDLASLSSGCWVMDLCAEDLDNDNDVDVVTSSLAVGFCDELVWHENDGGSPPSFTSHSVPQSKSFGLSKGLGASIQTADMNDDTLCDIVWAGTGYLAWYENSGGSPPSWIEHIIPCSVFLNAGTSVYAEDVDGDTDFDLVLYGTSQGELYWYESSGGSLPTFTERLIYPVGSSGSKNVLAADVDGDTDVDVVCHDLWFENSGESPPSWTLHSVYKGGSGEKWWGGRYMFASDLDRDGDTDLAYFRGYEDAIWYENDGNSPPSWTPHVIGIYGGVVFPSDVDNDSDVDMVSIHHVSFFWIWYENRLLTARGNVDGEGVIELGDVVYLINYLWKEGPAPEPLGLGDLNCDAVIDLGDVVSLINYLWKGGDPPGC
jgi:hypothetical protein